MNTFNISNVLTLISAAFIVFASGCGDDDSAGSTATVTTTSSDPMTTTGTSSSTNAQPTTSTITMSSASGSDTGEETSTGATTSTGGDGVCEDPSLPACVACNAMGEPQRLFGLTWNFASLPGERPILGIEELRCIDPETGASDLIGQIPGMDWLYFMINAHDPDAMILYAPAYAQADEIVRLFSIDTIKGELLANPPLDNDLADTFNWFGGVYVRTDGVPVGVKWNTDESRAELRSIDPQSGVSTLISVISEVGSLYFNAHAYDRKTDRIYTLGRADVNQIDSHLFVIDAMDGTLVSHPKLPEEHALPGMYPRKNGQLVGINIWKGFGELITINQETGATALIAEIPGFDTLDFPSSVYDPESDVISIIDAQSKLFQIDAATGQVLASIPLEPTPSNGNYNWSGGIHLR